MFCFFILQMRDKKVNSIKLTQRKIKQQTNIHGHETREELLKKWESKIQTVHKEISHWILDALKTTPEECKKKVKHIKSLQETTNEQIANILEEYGKEEINNIRKKSKNQIRDNLEKNILQLFEECETTREIITKTEENVIDLKRSKQERENLEITIKELAKRFFTTKKKVTAIFSLIEKDSFSQEITKKLEGYATYLKTYLQ